MTVAKKSDSTKSVALVEELIAATKDSGIQRILVHGELTGAPSVRLSPGQSLHGEAEGSSISFAAGTDGLQLSSDNKVGNIRLNAAVEKRAIFNDTSVAGLGRIDLRGVTTTGRLVVRRGIETFGGTGPSLVKGVVIKLSAIGLSVKPGGSAREIDISGGIKTHGSGVAAIEQHGSIETLRVNGGFVAVGGGFDKI
jgi:hypothetical protein